MVLPFEMNVQTGWMKIQFSNNIHRLNWNLKIGSNTTAFTCIQTGKKYPITAPMGIPYPVSQPLNLSLCSYLFKANPYGTFLA